MMKRNDLKVCTVVFSMLCANHSAARHEAPGLPSGVCDENECAPARADIWQRFEIAHAPNFGVAPAVYSGRCYHKGAGLNPEQPQYAGVLIDRRDSHLVFNAKFSFHVRKHPYAHLDVAGARKRFATPYPTNYEVVMRDSFAWVDGHQERTPFRYWFRAQQPMEEILLVGYLGFSHTILCDLQRHT